MAYKHKIKIFAPIIKFLWPVRILGRENFIECKGVYVCNHYSIMDANAICANLFKENFNVVVRHSAFKGIFKPILKAVNAIPVQRGEADMRAIKQCISVLRKGEPLVIFPEGTRNKTKNYKELLPFKEGPAMFALKASAPIIPMLYYKCPRLFRRTYLIVGKPIIFDDLQDMNISEARETATSRTNEAMNQLRLELDTIVENRGNRKAALLNEKRYLKQQKLLTNK